MDLFITVSLGIGMTIMVLMAIYFGIGYLTTRNNSIDSFEELDYFEGCETPEEYDERIEMIKAGWKPERK